MRVWVDYIERPTRWGFAAEAENASEYVALEQRGYERVADGRWFRPYGPRADDLLFSEALALGAAIGMPEWRRKQLMALARDLARCTATWDKTRCNPYIAAREIYKPLLALG